MAIQAPSPDSVSLSVQLLRLSRQMEVLVDEAGNLETACGWYHEDDPQFGGPPSVESLMKTAARLRAAYMEMALSMGLDPCEQLISTRARLRELKREAAVQIKPDSESI